MSWLSSRSTSVVLVLVSSACSAGVIDDGTGGGAFGTASNATTASTTMTTGATATGDSSGGGEGEGEGDVGSSMPADSGEAGSAVDSSGGVPASCGNDTREGDEVCDGTDLANATCADFGFDDGVLACDPACNLITDACFTCGDGEIALGEVCDGNEFAGATCTSLGFGGGALSCSADCLEIDDSGCTALPSCGDGLLNGGEQCDGNQLGGASCVTQGFDSGALDCTASCTYDVSACMDDLSGCGMMGDFCLFDEDDLQSTCCPAGVGGNVIGICNVIVCV